MTDKLDMPLDELIRAKRPEKKSKGEKGHGGNKRRQSGGGRGSERGGGGGGGGDGSGSGGNGGSGVNGGGGGGRKRHELVVVKNTPGTIGKRGGRGGLRGGFVRGGRGRGFGRGRGRGRAPRKPPNENLMASQNPDGSVGVLLHDAEVVTVGQGGEVTLNTAGQWTDETLDTMNAALEPLSVKVSAPDGAEGDWYVTDGHIWHVRMTGDSIVLPVIGYPPAARHQFHVNILRNAGGSAPSRASAAGEAAGGEAAAEAEVEAETEVLGTEDVAEEAMDEEVDAGDGA